MAKKESIKKVLELVFLKFPRKAPVTPTDFALLIDLWTEGYQALPDEILLKAARKFCLETTRIFDNDCPFAMIRETATIANRPPAPANVVPIRPFTPEEIARNKAKIDEILRKVSGGMAYVPNS
jgi:hypothetical protein